MGSGAGRKQNVRSSSSGSSENVVYSDYEIIGDEEGFISTMSGIDMYYGYMDEGELSDYENELKELGITIGDQSLQGVPQEAIDFLSRVPEDNINQEIRRLADSNPELFNYISDLPNSRILEIYSGLGSNIDRSSASYQNSVAISAEVMRGIKQSIPDFNTFRVLDIGDTEGNSLATYRSSNNTIRVSNTEVYDSSFRSGFHSAPYRSSVISHEIGHSVDKYISKNFKEIKDTFTQSTKGSRALSQYGTTSDKEAFAESFASYVTGGTRTNSYQRKFETLMDDVGLSSLKGIVTKGWD